MFFMEVRNTRQKGLVFEILGMFLFQTHHSEALMMFASLARILTKLRKNFSSFTVLTQINSIFFILF